MQPRTLPLSTALILTIPPLLWGGNAVVGRLAVELVPPMTLNFLRWLLAFLLLLPFAWRVLRRDSPLWAHWRRYVVLGLLGASLYNALLYLALHTSSPVNVTLVGGSMPIWMMLVGAVCYGVAVRRRQVAGALVSLAGVLIVLAQGDWQVLRHLQLVPGDLYVLLATLVWVFYSWMLMYGKDPESLRADWRSFMLAQVVFGVMWAGLFAGVEWMTTAPTMQWGWPLAGVLAYVSIGPAIIATACWAVGVRRVGANTASFFNNLIPLFAAVLSALILGEWPQMYHLLAFALIVGGIVLSSRR